MRVTKETNETARTKILGLGPRLTDWPRASLPAKRGQRRLDRLEVGMS